MANIYATVRVAVEPELRFTSGQDSKAVLNFRCAESHRKFDKQTNEWAETGTTWRNVSLWGNKAERMAEVLQKGDLVTVMGREQTRAYTSKDGTPGESLDLQADEVGLIQHAGQGGQQQGRQRQAKPQQRQADPWGQQAGGDYNWGEPASF